MVINNRTGGNENDYDNCLPVPCFCIFWDLEFDLSNDRSGRKRRVLQKILHLPVVSAWRLAGYIWRVMVLL